LNECVVSLTSSTLKDLKFQFLKILICIYFSLPYLSKWLT
jgi:hypothetical protein